MTTTENETETSIADQVIERVAAQGTYSEEEVRRVVEISQAAGTAAQEIRTERLQAAMKGLGDSFGRFLDSLAEDGPCPIHGDDCPRARKEAGEETEGSSSPAAEGDLSEPEAGTPVDADDGHVLQAEFADVGGHDGHVHVPARSAT